MNHIKKKIILLMIATFVGSYIGVTKAFAEDYFYFLRMDGIVDSPQEYPFNSSEPPSEISVIVSAPSSIDMSQDDTSSGNISVSLSINFGSADDISLSFSSSNNSVISASNITVSGSGSSRTMNISRNLADSIGSANIRISANVDGSEKGYANLNVSVNPEIDVVLADMDAVSMFSDQTTSDDIIVSFVVDGANEGDVSLSFSSDNENVVSGSNITESGSGLTRTLVITRDLSDALGTAIIRVSAKVNGVEEGFKMLEVSVLEAPSCNTSNPLDGMDKDVDFYLIGGAEGNSDRAKEEMLCLSQNQNAEVLRSDFKLMANVDFGSYSSVDWDGDGSSDGSSAEGWIPLSYYNNVDQSNNTYYDGIFDGNGKTIKNLYINRPSGIYQGLFAELNNGTIKDLTLSGVDITSGLCASAVTSLIRNEGEVNNVTVSGSITGTGDYAGGIACWANGSSSTQTSKILDSDVNVTISGGANVANVLGSANANVLIDNTFASGSATGTNMVGGLVGKMQNSSSVQDSGSSASVTASASGDMDTFSGGLVGYAYTDTQIYRSYATGNVSSSRSSGSSKWVVAGGLSGYNRGVVENSYATGNVSVSSSDANKASGGIIGYANTSELSNSYASGSVTGSSGAKLGSIIGQSSSSSVIRSYAINSSITAIGSGIAADLDNYCSVSFDTGCDAVAIQESSPVYTLTSDGNDYIDTGLTWNTNSKVQVYGRFVGSGPSTYPVILGTSMDGSPICALQGRSSGIFAANALHSGGSFGVSLGTLDYNLHTFTLDYISNCLSVSGKASKCGGDFTAVGHKLLLFAGTNTADKVSAKDHVKFEMHWAKVWESGVIKRNFEPRANGVLYDTVTGTSYTSPGTLVSTPVGDGVPWSSSIWSNLGTETPDLK